MNDIMVISSKDKFISLSPPLMNVSIHHEEQKVWKGYFIGSYLRLPVLFLLYKVFDPRLYRVSFCEALSIPLCMVATPGVSCRPPPFWGGSRSSTAPPIHKIFEAIQHSNLAWLFLSPLLVLCIYYLPFLDVCCVLTLTVSNRTTSRYCTGQLHQNLEALKAAREGMIWNKGISPLSFHFWVSVNLVVFPGG